MQNYKEDLSDQEEVLGLQGRGELASCRGESEKAGWELYRTPPPPTDRGEPRQGRDGGQIHVSWFPVQKALAAGCSGRGKRAHRGPGEHLQQEDSKTDLNLNVRSNACEQHDLQSQGPYQKTDNNTSRPGTF